MMGSPGARGFGDRAESVSTGLTHAVAVSLAIGALSLCLIVLLAAISIKTGIAMPGPA